MRISERCPCWCVARPPRACDAGTVGKAAFALAAVVLFTASPLLADTTPANRAMAQSLFDEGRRLMADHRYADACPKLAESQRLDPSVGTLLNLGVCYEQQGRLASAWEEFKEAAGEARRQGEPEREHLAEERASGLEPRLSHLTIAPGPGADLPGLVVKVDGETLGRPAWGAPMPVDGGVRSVTASADGHRPWSASVDIAPERDSRTVSVPLLEPEAAPAPSPPVPPSPVASPVGPPAATTTTPGAMSKTRIVGLAAGGAGAAGILAGSVFGVLTLSASSQQKNDCASAGSCSDRSKALSDHATMVTDGTIANVAFIAGGALLAAGTVLFFAGGSASSETAARGLWLTPGAGRDGGGVWLRGEF